MAKFDAFQKVAATRSMFKQLEKFTDCVTKYQLVTVVTDLLGFDALPVVNSMIRTGFLHHNESDDSLWGYVA